MGRAKPWRGREEPPLLPTWGVPHSFTTTRLLGGAVCGLQPTLVQHGGAPPPIPSSPQSPPCTCPLKGLHWRPTFPAGKVEVHLSHDALPSWIWGPGDCAAHTRRCSLRAAMAVPPGYGEVGRRKRSQAQSTPSGLWAGMEAGGRFPLHALAGGLPLPMSADVADVGSCLAHCQVGEGRAGRGEEREDGR